MLCCLVLQVLDLLELHGIGAVPIVNEQGRVVNIYSRSDITFLATAADPDSVLNNLDCKLCDILAQPGNEVSLTHILLKL
jgi:hypothetical protein